MHSAASNPFRPGIDTSTKMTSGLSSAAFCTASVPSTAHPQTIHTERVSRTAHKPFLIISLLSATRIRSEVGIGLPKFQRCCSPDRSGEPNTGKSIAHRQPLLSLLFPPSGLGAGRLLVDLPCQLA